MKMLFEAAFIDELGLLSCFVRFIIDANNQVRICSVTDLHGQSMAQEITNRQAWAAVYEACYRHVRDGQYAFPQ